MIFRLSFESAVNTMSKQRMKTPRCFEEFHVDFGQLSEQLAAPKLFTPTPLSFCQRCTASFVRRLVSFGGRFAN